MKKTLLILISILAHLSTLVALMGLGFSAQATTIDETTESQLEGSYEFVCEGRAPDLGATFESAAESLTLNCRFDTDCRFNEKCKYGRCVDRNSCDSDYDCDSGNICEFGRCKMAECRGGPYDCRAGERCRSGRCEHDPLARRCIRNEDCPTYERCSMGYCQ